MKDKASAVLMIQKIFGLTDWAKEMVEMELVEGRTLAEPIGKAPVSAQPEAASA